MGVKIIISSEEQQARLSQGYKTRIEKNELSAPRMVNDENRVYNVTQWASVTLGIFSSISFDFECDYVRKYKDQRAYSYFDSGFVDVITFYQYSEEIKYMYCKVQSSMTVTDHKNLWIAIKWTGLSLLPGVTAGASECFNHVIAALYKIEYASTHGFTNPACTSIPCARNTSTKREVKPKRINLNG